MPSPVSARVDQCVDPGATSVVSSTLLLTFPSTESHVARVQKESLAQKEGLSLRQTGLLLSSRTRPYQSTSTVVLAPPMLATAVKPRLRSITPTPTTTTAFAQAVDSWQDPMYARKTRCQSSRYQSTRTLKFETSYQATGVCWLPSMATIPSAEGESCGTPFQPAVCTPLTSGYWVTPDPQDSLLKNPQPPVRRCSALRGLRLGEGHPLNGSTGPHASQTIPTSPPHSEIPQSDGCDDTISSPKVRSQDRYVRGRPPTKEAFLLTRAGTKGPSDPFAPAVQKNSRTAAQFATLRSVSQPTVWSVNGSAVTEGVASTSNGRGGRITSGSNAPHYAADFLHSRSNTEETVTHGLRLAHAMDISQSGRVAEQASLPSSPISPASSCPSITGSPTQAFWKGCRWERPPETSPTKSKPAKFKQISTIPYRVLDAPELRDDYYCSLLAYTKTLQCLAVGLGPHVYLWSENRSPSQVKIPDSLTAPRESSHVTSVSFSSVEGGSSILAIGRGDGRITLWSPLDSNPRIDSEQPAPVSYVCFRPNICRRRSVRDPNVFVSTEELLVGDEAGNVYLYSVEWPGQDQRDLFNWHGSMTLLARATCHTQQICGIAWSPDGSLFATGGNDNNLFLFETKKVLQTPTRSSSVDEPAVTVRNVDNTATGLSGHRDVASIPPGKQKHTFSLNAACKAITFAPWQPSLIAAGGGSNDRCIHFFHALSGAKLATIDCYAQVTSLIFNPRKREIAATFGFAQPEHPYRVAVFAWPSCRMVLGIPWLGEERALYGIQYPGLGGSLVIATSDCSIKFHEVWSGKESDKGRDGSAGRGSGLGSPILDDELMIERVESIR